MYLPEQNITTDEFLKFWKGHLHSRQYQPHKSSKFKIKTFVFCDYTSGYLWHIRADTEILSTYIIPNASKSTPIVRISLVLLKDTQHEWTVITVALNLHIF
jgi:hypothetical protein